MQTLLFVCLQAGRELRHSFVHLLQTALFVASAVLLVEHYVMPLDAPARLIVSNVAAHDRAAAAASPQDDSIRDLAVLKIDPQTFRDVYGERSPLSRAKLTALIDSIIEALPKLQTLAIDLDLSPAMDKDEIDAGERLLARLADVRRERPGFRAILIQPVELDDRERHAEWMKKAQQQHGLLFADPDVELQLGMVHQHARNPAACPGLGDMLGSERGREPGCQGACLGTAGGEAERLNIDFLRFTRLAHYPAPRQTLAGQLDALRGNEQVTRAIVGPGYDRADQFTTPLGELNGVDIHAAIALQPDMEERHWVGFPLDVALGIAFGATFHFFWSAYFSQRLGRAGLPVGLAYGWLVAMVVVALALLLLLLVASSWSYLHLDAWISPTPMAVGMLFDALVLGSVHVVTAHIHVPPPPRGWRSIFYRAPRGIWYLTVGGALLFVVLHTVHIP